MNRTIVSALFLLSGALVYAGVLSSRTAVAQSMSSAPVGVPNSGYTLHIDADQHFGDGDPGKIAHHWCKTVSSTLSECQLYDSDAPNARLIGVETIIPTAVWRTLPASEQPLWHYHKTELKKIHATLPGMSQADAAKVISQIEDTYGKVRILWNPDRSEAPVGQPSITILK